MRKAAIALALFVACEKPAEPAKPPPRPSSPLLEVSFEPKAPTLHTRTPDVADGKKPFDYARFSVTILNASDKPVRIQSALLTCEGDRERRVVGDVKDRWGFADADRTIAAKGFAMAGGLWGFDADTPNRAVTYVFEFQYVVGDAKSATYTRAELKLAPE